MINYKQFLQEKAKPNEDISNKVYYHGTHKLENGVNILLNGFDVNKTREKYQDKISNFEPLKDKIYLTTDLRLAAIYAIGGIFFGYNYRPLKDDSEYGVIVQVNGNQLIDVDPDEDEVGALVSLLRFDDLLTNKGWRRYYTNYDWEFIDNSPEILNVAKNLNKFLSVKEYLEFKKNYEEVEYQAKYGKKLIENMDDDEKLAFIRASKNLAHGGHLKPVKGWKLKKSNVKFIKDDISNIKDYLEELK